MAIVTIPGFEPPVESLNELAGSSFEPSQFKEVCESFAPFHELGSDDDLWQFEVHIYVPLTVALYTEVTGATTETGYPALAVVGVSCAIMSFCWWETWLESDHLSQESYEQERKQFDRLFEEELERAIRYLGQPLTIGQNKDERKHRYAYWRGRSGLLILQQSAHDLQFGEDINYWVQPWSGADPQPTSPFIDWLHKQSRLPPGLVLPDQWELCDPDLERELARELSLNFLHPLRTVKSLAVARKTSSDEVLFQLSQHSHALAQVHLTWSKEFLPGAPQFVLFKTWDDWLSAQRNSDR